MAPHELIAPEACFIGIRAEQNALEANSDHASRVPKHYLQQKNELLTKDKLRQKCILEEVSRSTSVMFRQLSHLVSSLMIFRPKQILSVRPLTWFSLAQLRRVISRDTPRSEDANFILQN